MKKVFVASLALNTKAAKKAIANVQKAVQKISTTKATQDMNKLAKGAGEVNKESKGIMGVFKKLPSLLDKNNARFEKMRRVMEKIRVVSTKIASTFKSVLKVVTIVAAAVAATLGLVYNAVRGSIERRQESNVSGLTQKQVEAAKYATEQSGLNVDFKAIQAAKGNMDTAALMGAMLNKNPNDIGQQNSFKLFGELANALADKIKSQTKNADGSYNMALAQTLFENFKGSEMLGLDFQEFFQAMKSGQLAEFQKFFDHYYNVIDKRTEAEYAQMNKTEQAGRERSTSMETMYNKGINILAKAGEEGYKFIANCVQKIAEVLDKLKAGWDAIYARIDKVIDKIMNLSPIELAKSGAKSIGNTISNGANYLAEFAGLKEKQKIDVSIDQVTLNAQIDKDGNVKNVSANATAGAIMKAGQK